MGVSGSCGAGGRTPDGHGEHARGQARVGGQVVSTVEGHAITLEDVQHLVAKHGLLPREALRRLQDERVLMVEAERRGFSDDPEAIHVALQAGAQALLESVADSAVISDQELRAAYEKSRARFERPERRAAVHVLAKLPSKPNAEDEAAARAFAADIIDELAAAEDLEAFLKRAREQKRPEFEVVAETLPAVSRDSNFVEPFLDALFGASEAGVLREPVRTSFGWHAIRLTEIIAPEKTPYSEALATLRAELLLERQMQLVEDLLERARKEHGVSVSQSAANTLAALEP